MFSGSTQNNLGFPNLVDLGEIGYPPLAPASGGYTPPYVTSSVYGNQTGGSGQNLAASIITAGGQIASSIFANKNPYAANPYRPVTESVVASTVPNQATSAGAGAGAALDNLAGGFGISTTTMLLVGGLGLFLLMSPPPRRR